MNDFEFSTFCRNDNRFDLAITMSKSDCYCTSKMVIGVCFPLLFDACRGGGRFRLLPDLQFVGSAGGRKIIITTLLPVTI